MCDTCGTMNSNGGINGYGFSRNVYNLYDCAAEFMEDLDKRVTYEYADDTYHTVTTKGGSYCCFCYGTIYESSSKLERHSMVTEVLPQPANGRFAVVEKCSLCDYCCTRGWMTVLNACCDALGTSALRCDAESGSCQDEGHLYRNTGENQCHRSTGAAAARTAGIRPGTGTQGDAADEASADGAEQTASEYITRSRHFGNDRYSAKCGGSFTQKY